MQSDGTRHTDVRRGMQGLALTVQQKLKRDPIPAIPCRFTCARFGSIVQ
jgi:hypothetical protein